jgi:predicted RNA methylase
MVETMARLLTLAVIGLLSIGCDDAERRPTAAPDVDRPAAPTIKGSSDPTTPKGSVEVQVNVLNETMTLFPSVFNPRIEADRDVLPFMSAHRDLFEGKRVMEIGTGSGVISLYAAKLGAAAVVATDINPEAVACARFNAKKLGYDDVMEVRLVSEDDSMAFAVIEDDERFDLIISNPPYALVLDDAVREGIEGTVPGFVHTDIEVAEGGDLGFSIIDGLDKHLNPGGVAALLYQSMFYQQVMVQYAQKRGFDVKHHLAYWLAPSEMESLFDAYTAQFLKYKKLPKDFITFDHKEDDWAKAKIRIVAKEYPPLIREDVSGEYPGFIIVKAK